MTLWECFFIVVWFYFGTREIEISINEAVKYHPSGTFIGWIKASLVPFDSFGFVFLLSCILSIMLSFVFWPFAIAGRLYMRYMRDF